MSLAAYHRKRDFAHTREPKGRVHAGRKSLRFCIQKHDASHLHYDFRLEYQGVLKSWAVPKGPSLDPAVKSLAIEVEDHPIEYGDFEGTIPEGEYGGGTVMLWDRGHWTAEGDAGEGLKKGKLSFELSGEKLNGRWTLVRLRPRKNERKNHWLLMKASDEFAKPGSGAGILEEKSLSVKTGRDLGDIAAGRKRRARKKASTSKEPVKSHRRASRPEIDPAMLTNARRAQEPDWVEPQLATLVEHPPEGNSWIYEVKFDGYRMIGVRRGDSVRLITRNEKNWTDRFKPIAEAIKKIPAKQLILDGEVVVLNEEGKSAFQSLQNSLRAGRPAGQMLYVVFDILYCDGFDVRGAPLLERKELLEALLRSASGGHLFISGTGTTGIQYSEHSTGDGNEALRQICKLGEEGLIFKRADLPYVSRRTQGWLKMKCSNRREFVIGGFTDPKNSRMGFGALLLGFHDDKGNLRYCGRVGTGFNAALLRDLHKRLSPLEQASPAFANPPRGADARGVHWVRPSLVAEVSYLAMTSDGILRHSSFEGLRMDKRASEVVDEVPADAGKKRTAGKIAKSSATKSRPPAGKQSERVTIASVSISHPDRVLFPDSNITKRLLAEYYEAVAERMLPLVIDRPLMLVRCPQGVGGECFHQKHIPHAMPAGIRGITIKEKSTSGVYPLVQDNSGLVSLVQMNAVELHGWQSRAGDLERPDQVIFDLDPGEGVAWREVAETAFTIREILQECDLVPFLKTSGGKGLHLVVPLKPAATWDEVKGFAEAVSLGIARAAPNRFVEKMTKSIRSGKIYIDFHRNGRGATCVLPYSTRNRPGAPVSLPIAWEVIRKIHGASEFSIQNVPTRIRRSKNPWRDFDKRRRPITHKMLSAVGI